MRTRYTPRRRERGGALIVVLIVLVLLSALALEVAATASTQGRLSGEAMDDFLMRTAVEGRREVLKSAILYARKASPQQVREDQDCFWYNHQLLGRWSDTAGPGAFSDPTGEDIISFTNTKVEQLAWCEDERAKLCLLGLVQKGNDEKNSIHDRTRVVLIRLIDVYREAWSDLDLSESDAEEMVDALIEYLHRSADDAEESPLPKTPEKIGRIQTLDDLQRIPGWTAERLFDVQDPDWEQEDEEVRRLDPDDDSEEPEEGMEDDRFFRQNGPPGLARFLTLHAQGKDDPQIRINFNTAPLTLLKALFDPQNHVLAESIVSHRREGVGSAATDPTAAGGEQGTNGYFTGAADVAKVEGFDENWQTTYPEAASFFDVDSRIFSLWVIGKVVKESEDGEDVDEDVVREAVSTYQYHEIVEYVAGTGQQSGGSLVSRMVERRRDPFFNRN